MLKHLVFACILALPSLLEAEVKIPQTMSYQGIIKDSSGTLVDDGTYGVTFKLYDAITGGNNVWSEQHSVSIRNGIMSVVLGSVSPLNITFDRQYWLGIAIGENAEMTPRLQLTATPYSLTALSISDSTITTAKIPARQVVKSINGLRDSVIVEAGDNVSITSHDNKLTISSTGASNNGVNSINALQGDITLTAGSNVTISKDTTGKELTFSASSSGLSLPYSGSTTSSSDAFKVSTTGSGTAATFQQNNSTTYSSALSVETKGTGSAGSFAINNSNNLFGTAISSRTNGNGRAGEFFIDNSSNSDAVLWSRTYGSGYAGYFIGLGNNSKGIYIESPDRTLQVYANGSGNAIQSVQDGIGWAGSFFGNGTNSNGVYISAPLGKTGLNVGGGTKNAIVPTSQGARKLYTEESTQVWFSDYGYGTMQNGSASITIDPLFAETVNITEKYHVFIQPYGDAVLYVSKRTPTEFEVRSRDGDTNVEFSYRLVAKRKGYEQTRLEHEPDGDNDPNLYPERASKVAQKKSLDNMYLTQQEKEAQSSVIRK